MQAVMANHTMKSVGLSPCCFCGRAKPGKNGAKVVGCAHLEPMKNSNSSSPGIHRRQFVKMVGGTTLVFLAGPSVDAQKAGQKPGGGLVFLEAEQFADLGGWDLDQQSMDQMGSPYLLAHGLGVPVQRCGDDSKFSAAGNYRVWVRTRDWVAPWKAPGAPGKFQVLLDGEPLEDTFGTRARTGIGRMAAW